jgi:hypothetical protein
MDKYIYIKSITSMNFINNKYLNIYYSIINNAKLRKKINGYTEKHHIIPRSLGGSNDLDNLVPLTAKEHFVCHRLLVRITKGKNQAKMIFALGSMMNRYNTEMKRYVPNGKTYEYLRKQLSKAHKTIGRTPEHIESIKKAHTGKIVSEETKKRMSESIKLAGPAGGAIKGSKRSEETCRKISESRKGVKLSKEHRKNLSEARKHVVVSKETGRKISAALSGKLKKKLICPHCNLEGGDSQMKRWHFDNCKYKKAD